MKHPVHLFLLLIIFLLLEVNFFYQKIRFFCLFVFIIEETHNIDWQWFAQTLNPYYEHDESTSAMLIDDDRLIFHTIDENHWDFGKRLVLISQC